MPLILGGILNHIKRGEERIMNIFFKRLLLYKHTLSSLEEKVFDYFIHNQKEILDISLQELSDKIFISAATISRTCKKLGYSGFQEFQYSFKQFSHNPTVDLDDFSGESNYIKKVMNDIQNNTNLISKDQLTKIVEYLFQSNFVEIFGMGRSYSVCREGASKLTFSGRITSARSDWDEQAAVAKYLTKNDLAILVSISGETTDLIKNAKTLKENDVPIIAIVGTSGSTLMEYADLFVHIDITPTYVNEVDVSSHFLFSILFDTFAISYMQERLTKEM